MIGVPKAFRRSAVCAALAGALLMLAAGPACRQAGKRRGGPLDLYVRDAAAVRSELERYTGQKADFGAARRMEQARKLAESGDYRAAISMLEEQCEKTELPALRSNLGALYAALGDSFNARESFQAALRLDPSYQAAKQGIERLQFAGLIEEVPVTQEVEPNNLLARANTIALDASVSGDIGNHTDVDAYRFKAPAGRRDIMEIMVTPSTGLAPSLRIRGGDQRLILWNRDAVRPGSGLTQVFSPAPGESYFVEVFGQDSTAGAYTITVRPAKAYDSYEPNDSIVAPTRLPGEGRIDAGIMDRQDTDYYTFTSQRSGKMTIVIENRSASLVPAVTLYGADRAILGFGPDVHKAGANLTHSLRTEAGHTYSVQVWGALDSSGNYSLVLK